VSLDLSKKKCVSLDIGLFVKKLLKEISLYKKVVKL